MRIALILIVFLSACTLKHTKKNPEIALPPMEVGGIVLKPHQIIPIKYLLEHPEQKGLLIAHYLGTGKTFLSLAFAEKAGDGPVFILVPSFLKASWIAHMNRIQLKRPERYQIWSYEEASSELSKDKLKDAILIVDEIHRLVTLTKSENKSIRAPYAKLYGELSGASRILALSGTPIFTDLSDIAYILNLVSGEDLLPYNNREFLDQYTKIERSRSFWRGHFTESQLLIFGLPFVLAAIPLAFITPYVSLVSGIYFGGLAAGFLSFPIINASIPLNRFPLRYFDGDKLKSISSKFASFYDFRGVSEKEEFYPSKSISTKNVPYNDEQIEFFLEFADKSLNAEQVKRLALEKSYDITGNFEVESTTLQNEIASIPLSGREIGNFDFLVGEGSVEAPKFEEIYKVIGSNPQGIVVYSSYYENGLLLFQEFLRRKGLAEKAAILHPDQTVAHQIDIIARYNQGEIKILLLHPLFTEGISLEMTRQLHILEALGSEAIYEQVIGRVVRLHSHARLEKHLRHVDVYEWASTLSGIKAFLAKNNNWAARFRELNSVSAFGKGQTQIDPNYLAKAMSPDEFTREKRFFISNAMSTLRDLFSQYSIEGAFP